MVKASTTTRNSPKRVALLGAAAAIDLAAARPDVLIDAFDREWDEVDRIREQINHIGLAERIAVHHIDAMQFADLAAYDSIAPCCVTSPETPSRNENPVDLLTC
jgi:tRNA1(Val) A37 N6-methylase TrmN6